MEKEKNQYKYYSKDHPYLSTLSLDKRVDYAKKQKILLRIVVVFMFFMAEGVMMWAMADSKVSYSPVQNQVEVAKKKPKKTIKVEEKQVAAEAPAPAPSFNPADMYVVIPKLYINAPVEPVGVTASGEMATSKSLTNVAWYKDGAKPGDTGSAVLAGHYGAPNETGIFRSIDKLKTGDTIEIKNKSGSTAKFSIYNIATYKVSEVPLQDLFNRSDGKYLNLITCVGTWDNSTSTYDQRMVAYSKLVE